MMLLQIFSALLLPSTVLLTYTKEPESWFTMLDGFDGYTTIPTVVAGNAFIDHNIALSAADRHGKRTVLHYNMTDGTAHPICDDGFTDLEATILCGLLDFERGRRTSKTTNKKFYGTNLSCFDKPKIFESFWDGGVKVKYADVAIDSRCTMDLYEEDTVLPCAPTQALAVYCWTTEKAVDVAIDSIKTTQKKWSFVFKMFDFKMGRWFNVFDKALGSYEVLDIDFAALHCDEEPPKFSMTLNYKKKQFAYSGGFVKGCTKCVELYYLSHQLFPDYVCPDDPYSLTAHYNDGFDDAGVDYKAG